MDPTANLKEQLKLANTLHFDVVSGEYESVSNSYTSDVDRLCELVLALDEWMKKGGFLPAQWRKR